MKGKGKQGSNLQGVDTVTLLEKLIEIQSPTGQESEISNKVSEYLSELGFRIQRQQVDEGRYNLLATTDANPLVLLCTHLDTVLPHLPFTRSQNVVRGRGACDAKGAVAAMIGAAYDLLNEDITSFGLLFVVGEEKHSDGARAATQLRIGSEYVILGEPTENRLAAGQKGTIVFRLHVEGKEGHSAYPELGSSAIHQLVDLLHTWQESDWGQDKEMGANTLNIGRISGGTGANVIAGEAEAEGIMRLATPSTPVLEKMRSGLTEAMSLEVISCSEPMRLFVLDRFEQSIVSFGSDAPYLRPLGEVLMLGPGSIRYAHSIEEQVTCEELEQARRLYTALVKELLSREAAIEE